MIKKLDDLWLNKPWVYLASCLLLLAACAFGGFLLGIYFHRIALNAI